MIKRNVSKNLKKIVVVINVILLTSCGQPPPPRNLDPYFVPFLIQFKQDADKRHVSYANLSLVTVIKFGDVDDADAISQCQNHDGDYESMNFREEYKSLPEDYKYRLMLHEIGHCVYGLPHKNDEFAIMNPYLVRRHFVVDEVVSHFFDDVINMQKNSISLIPVTFHK